MHTTRCTRRDRAILLTGFLLILCILTWKTVVLFPIQPPFVKLLDGSFENFSLIEVADFKTSMAALKIVDIATRDPLNRIVVRRRIVNMERSEIFISEVELLVPKDLHDGLFNTTLFSVDHGKLNVAARPLIAPPFAIGSLSMDKDEPSNVLIIGLGGSQMNNYLHHTFPNMNLTIIELETEMVEIAIKYFGLKTDPKSNVLIMDGKDFLEQCAQQGRKFDAIYVDACPTNFPYQDEILCPIGVFLEKSTIKNMKRCLSDQGTLAVKMLLFTANIEERANSIAGKYREEFRNCTIMPMISELNRVLVCSGDDVPETHLDKSSMLNNKAKFYNEFGLAEIPPEFVS